MQDLAIARALHVLSVVHWIGGVSFVTLIALPMALARGGADGFALFEAVERRFAAQVRFSIPLAGASGLWLAYRLNIWSWFVDPRIWWAQAMLAIWTVFMLMVFVAEPLLHHKIESLAAADPDAALRRIGRLHMLLLALAALTAAGAVAGSQGESLF